MVDVSAISILPLFKVRPYGLDWSQSKCCTIRVVCYQPQNQCVIAVFPLTLPCTLCLRFLMVLVAAKVLKYNEALKVKFHQMFDTNTCDRCIFYVTI